MLDRVTSSAWHLHHLPAHHLLLLQEEKRAMEEVPDSLWQLEQWVMKLEGAVDPTAAAAAAGSDAA